MGVILKESWKRERIIDIKYEQLCVQLFVKRGVEAPNINVGAVQHCLSSVDSGTLNYARGIVRTILYVRPFQIWILNILQKRKSSKLKNDRNASKARFAGFYGQHKNFKFPVITQSGK